MNLLLNPVFNFFLDITSVIPKLVYYICVSFMSMMDVFQLAIRKLAGLDTYYIGNGTEEHTGDIALTFINSIFDTNSSAPALKNAFWSLIILGVIMLIITTIIAIIRQEYMPGTEESKEKPQNNKFIVVSRSIKSLFLFLIVPVSALFGMMFANVALQAFDKVVIAQSSDLFTQSNVITKLRSEEHNGTSTYIFYDIFTASYPSNSTSFSGMMFKSSAFAANRVRINQELDGLSFYEQLKQNNIESFDIFNQAGSQEEMALMIDDAFANNIHLNPDVVDVKMNFGVNSANGSSLIFGLNEEEEIYHFSKFNIGLVWYYYDLWQFNFIIGFAFLIIGTQLLVNIVAGLMKRLIELVALFIISPPIIAVMPLDEGKMFNKWRENFMSRALGAFGVIVGMNILFLILPYIQLIKIFPPEAGIYFFLNLMISTIFVIVGLTLVESFIGLVSKLIGADDPAASGGKLVSAVGDTIKKSAMLAGGGVGLALAGAKMATTLAYQGSAATFKGAAKGIEKFKDRKLTEDEKKAKKDKLAAAKEQKERDRKANLKNKSATLNPLTWFYKNATKKIMEQGKEKADQEWDREGGAGDQEFDAKMSNEEGYKEEIDTAYQNYTKNVKNGQALSKDQWLKDKTKSVKAKALAEQNFAKRANMTRDQYKNDAQRKQEYINQSVDTMRRDFMRTKNQAIGKKTGEVYNSVLKNSGLANLSTTGELLLEEMKDTFVRGGKGGFPGLFNMFLGKSTAHDIELFGLKKKQQKEESMRVRVQQELKEEREKNKKS